MAVRTLNVNAPVEGSRIASDSDADTFSTPTAAGRTRPVFLVALALMATTLLAFSLGSQAKVSPSGEHSAMGPARKLLQSPELTELVLVQVRNTDRNAQLLAEGDIRSGVRKFMDEFGALVDEHLDAVQRPTVWPRTKDA